MSTTIILLCGLASLVSSLPATFDNVNVDALLGKPEVVDAYVECLLGNSPCTESGLRLKAITPNALLEKCSQCTPYQRESVQKISKAISTKKPAEWEKILQKYDPTSAHRSEIESLVNAKTAEAEAKPAEAKPEDAPKPAELAKPEDAPKPAELAKPEDAPKQAEPAKPEDAPKPAEPAKPEDAPKPAEAAKPEGSLKSALKPEEPEKLAEAAKPLEPAKLEEPLKPELAKPAEPEKPADLAKKPEALSS